MASLTTILNWFKEGLKPSETQFSETFSSFRHKDDKVPVNEVDGLDVLLQSKADNEALVNHINDEEAHSSDQFTETVADKLRALVYVEATASLSRDKASIEKGVSIAVEFTWDVTPNEDTITDVVFDGNTGSENSGNETFNTSQTITKTLVVRRQSGGDITRSITTTAYIPQYRGQLDSQEPNDYNYYTLSGLTKTISSSATQNYSDAVNNKHVAFLSTKENATLKDNGTGFNLTVGDFTSTTAFFLKKEVTVKLADNTTTTMYLYVTRQKVSATINFGIL